MSTAKLSKQRPLPIPRCCVQRNLCGHGQAVAFLARQQSWNELAPVSREFWIAALFMAGFAIYVVAKVRMYMKQSEEEWRQVDKSKLKTWTDEED